MANNNFREEVTNQLIDLIEKGQAPWQKPWDPTKSSHVLAMPHNAVTGRPYRGGNALYLMLKQGEMGDPRWCTYKQAQDKGWQVKKGSKSSLVEYWKFDETKEIPNPDTGEKEKVKIKYDNPRVFYANVFHASQIDGIPEYKPQERNRDHDWDPVELAEQTLKHSGARIYHDQQDRAFYRPSTDEIHLPPQEAFPQAVNYYETALHELAHWTGHESRLNRSIMNRFGTENYAKEELRAEIASLFLSIETGVPFNPGNHGGINIDNQAAYVKSWSRSLKDDKNEIFKAARDAEIIADYVLGLAREKALNQTIAVPISEIAPDQVEPQQPTQTLQQIESEKRLVKIMKTVSQRTLPDIYRSNYQKMTQEGIPRPMIDEKIVAQLLTSGKYTEYKVKEVINRCSPEAALFPKGKHADELLKKVKTPEFKKQMEKSQQEVSR